MSENDIAIVGMACRFPGARDVSEYWDNLLSGKESVRFFDEQELIDAGVDERDVRDPRYVKATPALEDFDKFDARFFGFNPREAALMDPQHRLLLESAVGALEDGGCDPARFDGRIGVFAGSAMNTYFMAADLKVRFAEEYIPTLIGSDKDFLATRISYKLNLTGPSLTIQTACSTSLVAVHLACQSLLNEECDAALAGGVSVRVPHHIGYRYLEQGVYSRDGHCRPFDAQASGTIFGSGVGMVALKRVADAVKDRDHVYAVVKGSAINNDGSSKADYTAPSVASQSEVIAEALAVADVEPESVGYVEAHGTGTYLGDPIEVEALNKAFATDRRQYCGLGSVKSNFGHLDAAAGVAGLIKVALCVEHGVIPPTVHFQEPNPQIDFVNSPFFVVDERRDWKGPRYAGITSLGIGGTNAHVVLGEAPATAASESDDGWQLLCLSAKTEAALGARTDDLANFLDQHPDTPLADVAYTTQVGRPRMNLRRTFVCRNAADAVRALRDPTAQTSDEQERTRPVTFLFAGNGTQYPRMGADLYAREAVYKQAVDECIASLDFELLPHVFEDSSELDRPSLAQPAIFVTNYAAARLWMSWGLRPDSLIGHSLGEYVAACLSEVLSLKDALALVRLRGQLMEKIEPGSMLSVALSEEKLADYIEGPLSIAAINAPELCAAAGPVDAVARLEEKLAGDGVAVHRLRVAFAAHTSLIDPILKEFEGFVRTLKPGRPKIPVMSCLTGAFLTDEQAIDPGYWVTHLREPVRFAHAIKNLLAEPERIFIEASAGSTLTQLTRIQSNCHTLIPTIRHAREEIDDHSFVLGALGSFWRAGGNVEWPSHRHRKVPLPTYAFERVSHWIDAQQSLGPASVDGTYAPTWKRMLPSVATREPRRFLFPVDDDGMGKAVAARLRELGHEVDMAGEVSDDVDHVVCFEPGFHELLSLAQALGERTTEECRLDIVTRGLFDVIGDETLNPTAALALGPARVIPREYPHIRTRTIDGDDAERIAAELCMDGAADCIALRGRHRWGHALEPVEVTKCATRMREGGTYLITGGLGELGLKLAAALAERYKAKLVLVGRSAPDAAKQARITELERMGAEVLVCRANVADAEQMQGVVSKARERFGSVHGAIHMAGVLDDGIIAMKDPAEADNVLAPKVQGTRVLRDLLPDVDFLVLYSSIVSYLAPAGTVDYVAANAYLNAFATAQAQPFTLAIAWPGWKGSDMVERANVSEEVLTLSIDPDRGVETFFRLLDGNVNHVVVAARDPRTIRMDRSEETAHDRPELATEYAAPETEIEEAIAGIWEELLGVKRIGVHDVFADLGGHSLLATQVIARLRKALGVKLTIKDIFEQATIAALAAHVEELILAEIEQ